MMAYAAETQAGVAVGEPTSSTGTVLSDAAQWIREKWGVFVALEPEILNLQHRAAMAAAAAKQAGDELRYDMGRVIITDLGELSKLHGKVVDKVTELSGYLGLNLGGYQLGAIAVPVAVALTFATIATVMLWLMQRLDLQRRLVEGLEAGTLTHADLAALEDKAPGGDVLGTTLGIGKLALVAFIGWLLLQALQQVPRLRSNPDLLVFHGNPPELEGAYIGENVYALTYQHADNSEPYVHNFRPGVEVWGNPDGSVTLSHPDHRRLWGDF